MFRADHASSPIVAFVLCLQASAALGQQAPAPRGDPESWVQIADYPPALLKKGWSSDVELEVAPTGQTVSCRIVHGSGSGAWDSQLCAILRRRSRFQPALDAAGKPVSGSWQHRFSWTPPAA
jgi:hypothetical protein